MLWLVRRKSDVVKLNINIERNIGISHMDEAVQGGELMRLKFIWLGGAKYLNADWDVSLLKHFGGRIHRPMALEFLGREITVIVDGNDDVVERVIRRSGIDLPTYNLDGTVDYGDGFTKIKVMPLIRNQNLPLPQVIADADANSSTK
jgi:hypothetical protein